MIKFLNIKRKIIYSVLCSVLIMFLLPLTARAVEIFFESEIQEMGVGQEFRIDLMLDTQGEIINALEGKIVFPEDLLEIKEIKEGDSVISLWVEKPSVINNEIIFSGIIPAGFSGVMEPYREDNLLPGKIISLILVSRNEGIDSVNFKNGRILLHDGKGTPAELEISNFEFLISKQIPITQIPITEIDVIPPEFFEPEISQHSDLFGGKYFLVFMTQDKESGIDHYALFESRRKKEFSEIGVNDWIISESPYVLQDQGLKSYIYIKAVDKAGNERIVVIEPKYPLKWYEKTEILVIIILIIALLWLILKKFKKQRGLRIFSV